MGRAEDEEAARAARRVTITETDLLSGSHVIRTEIVGHIDMPV